MAQHTEAPARGRVELQELLVTILLVAAAVATAWSSYQAARWHGEQAAATSHTNAIRIDAARQASLGEAETQVDVATFIAWAAADRQDEDDLAAFYLDRFRPEFVPAFKAWIATRPLTNEDAPPTPFVMDEYQVASRNESERLDKAAGASAAKVTRDIQIASNYVLTVVLYAVALFFAGMSTKLSSNRLRWAMTLAGCTVLVGTIAWLATFPVSVAI
jgi:hypothetical protein